MEYAVGHFVRPHTDAGTRRQQMMPAEQLMQDYAVQETAQTDAERDGRPEDARRAMRISHITSLPPPRTFIRLRRVSVLPDVAVPIARVETDRVKAPRRMLRCLLSRPSHG